MNKNKIDKLDNPKRIEELNPEDTLKRLGMGADSVIFDYGAGSGVFAIAACEFTGKPVYAFDIDEASIDAITQKANQLRIENIVTLNKEGFDKLKKDIWADIVILSAVYHEINNKDVLFTDLSDILKENGKIAVIEFQKTETPMGPPPERRISIKDLKEQFSKRGFTCDFNFVLGNNFYLAVFKKE